MPVKRFTDINRPSRKYLAIDIIKVQSANQSLCFTWGCKRYGMIILFINILWCHKRLAIVEDVKMWWDSILRKKQSYVDRERRTTLWRRRDWEAITGRGIIIVISNIIIIVTFSRTSNVNFVVLVVVVNFNSLVTIGGNRVGFWLVVIVLFLRHQWDDGTVITVIALLLLLVLVVITILMIFRLINAMRTWRWLLLLLQLRLSKRVWL